MPRLLTTILAIILVPTSSAGAKSGAVPTFERDVLPILSSHCLQCHGGIHQRGSLDLRTAASTLAGGERLGFAQGRYVAFNNQVPVVAVNGQAPPVNKDLGKKPACVSDLLRTISERMGVEAKGFGENRRTLAELIA